MKKRIISMRKIKTALYQKFVLNKSDRAIAQSISVGRTTVQDYVRRAKAAHLTWPLPDDYDDAKLDVLLFPPRKNCNTHERGQIDWADIHKEMMRKGVTLQLLWHEYRAQYPKGYSYSRFCKMYRDHQAHLSLWMRQTHKAGEIGFVDYAGMTMPIVINANTGETVDVQIFVMALGASGRVFVEATYTQALPDWTASHAHAFEFYGGVPEILVPDNLKSGVNKSHRYDPDNNPTYCELAQHYGVAIMPARVRSPQDKAKAEQAVQQVENQILAPLRDRKFFHLTELNTAIRPLQTALNEKPFQKLPGSRESLFEEIDKGALKPLPKMPYEYAQWKCMKADGGYHIELEQHYYSVPHQYARKKIDIRYTQTIVECFHKGKSVALHQRSEKKGAHTTQPEHMTKQHRAYAEWTPERVLAEAQSVGGATQSLIKEIFAAREHYYIASRACLGILRLKKQYGQARLEAACAHALKNNLLSCQSLESILKCGLDSPSETEEKTAETSSVTEQPHENIRDDNYYV